MRADESTVAVAAFFFFIWFQGIRGGAFVVEIVGAPCMGGC